MKSSPSPHTGQLQGTVPLFHPPGGDVIGMPIIDMMERYSHAVFQSSHDNKLLATSDTPIKTSDFLIEFQSLKSRQEYSEFITSYSDKLLEEGYAVPNKFQSFENDGKYYLWIGLPGAMQEGGKMGANVFHSLPLEPFSLENVKGVSDELADVREKVEAIH